MVMLSYVIALQTDKDKMRKEMEAEIRAQLALNQEAMQSWDEKVRTLNCNKSLV